MLRVNRYTLIICLTWILSSRAYACGNGTTQAPCAPLPIASHAIVAQNERQAQMVAALQQQAARSAISPTSFGEKISTKDETFVTSSLSPLEQRDTLVARIIVRNQFDQVAFHFPGEGVGYAVPAAQYEAMLRAKKIIPIGNQFVAVPFGLISHIKAMVIAAPTQKNLKVVVKNDAIELVAKD